MTTPTVPVIVTPIPLTRAVYDELLEGLKELDGAFGKTAEAENARRWLHYKWLVEGQAGKEEAK